MKQIKYPRLLWVILVIVLLLLGLLAILAAVLPYEYQKNLLDYVAPDGDLESFSRSVFSITRAAAGVLAIIFATSMAVFIIFKDRSRAYVEQLPISIGDFVRLVWVDLKRFISWIRPRKRNITPLIILGFITGFGIFFRYSYLWRPMGHDEAYTFMAFASRGLRTVITDYHLPNNHVFHSILVNLAYELFGDSPAVIRLPALLAGILIIPATYLAARIFANVRTALISSSVIAFLPVLIDYSTTARGYTIITLFFLLILVVGAFVKDNRNLIGWLLIILFSSLGIFTNPTMIYPIGVVFTWLLLSMLLKDVSRDYGKKFLRYLIPSAVLILIISVLLYAPIILVSGLGSITSNNVVEALGWQDFSESIPVRIRNTWAEWNRNLPTFVSLIALIGLTASFITPVQKRPQRITLSIAGGLWIGAILLVQRVAPWPRIWLFFLPLFVIWITSGLAGIIELIIPSVPQREVILRSLFGLLIAGPLLLGLIWNYPQFNQKLHSKGAVEQAGDYLYGRLQPPDVVIATSPDNVILKYYLRRLGLPDDITDISKGKSFERAMVVVNQTYGQDLESVLDGRSLLDDVNINSAEVIYESDRIVIYQVSSN